MRKWKWVWLPVFLVAVLVNPFLPAEHPWSGRKESLESWRDYGTELAYGFALLFWWCGSMFLLGLAVVHSR